jgi:3-oxoadipate enol-lactonase
MIQSGRQTIDVRGQKLNVAIDGTRDAPWLVFSNSLATDLHLWDPQIPVLAKDWSILRYDFRGHGRSGASIDSICDVNVLANDLLALLDYHGAERVCHVGVSMGAVAGVAAAIKSPSRFASLVVCNSRLRSNDESQASLDDRARRALDHGMQSLVDLTLEKWFGRARLSLADKVRNQIASMIENTRASDFAAYARGMAHYDLEDEMINLGVPISLLAGTDDGSIKYDFLALRERAPAIRCVFIEGAGHLPNVHAIDDFNAKLLSLPLVHGP